MTVRDALIPAWLRVFERGWLSSNNILVIGERHAALVDTGYATHSQQTVGLVRSVLRERDLDVVVNTHLHSDHCGGNAALQAAFPNLVTLIPPGLAQHVRNWNPVLLTYEPTGQICPRFSIQGVVSPGGEVMLGERTWQVLAAPGHDPNSVILFEPESSILLSADALWENGFGIVFPELEGDDAFGEVSATLDLIASLRPRVVVPGHGRPFSDVGQALVNARRRLQAYVSDPGRHAGHASKVLVKFKLLEQQQMDASALIAWASSTAYLEMVRLRWFSGVPFETWIHSLVEGLVASGAARLEGSQVVNA